MLKNTIYPRIINNRDDVNEKIEYRNHCPRRRR